MTRVCCDCNLEKPIDQYYKQRKSNGAINTRRRCKACCAIYRRDKLRQANIRSTARRWRERNRDKWRAMKRNQRKNKAAREGRLFLTPEERSERKKRNAERKILLRVLRKIIQTKHVKIPKWMKSRKRYATSKTYRDSQIRKAKKRKELMKARSDGSLTSRVAFALLMQYPDCLYCGALLDRDSRSLDHIVPLNKGGLHSASNLIVCCKRCNVTRQDKSMDEWMKSIDAIHHGKIIDRIGDRGTPPPPSGPSWGTIQRG